MCSIGVIRSRLKFIKFRNCLDVLEITRILLNILELAIVLKIHPARVRLSHIQCLLAHVLQIDHDRFNHRLHLLALQHLVLYNEVLLE